MTSTEGSRAPSAPPAGQAVPSRGAPLAWILALAYTLLVVYASLQPFRDWRQPSAEILHFLSAPWPRYITLDDVLINVAAYVPLGFLLALALGTRLRAPWSVLGAALLAAVLSLAMEYVQAFLATRIASRVDLLTNGAGGLFGAMAALLFSPSRFPGRRIAAWRARVLVSGAVADSGLVIAFLWLATHLHPTAQLFGAGNLRGTFELPARLHHAPQLLLSAEAAIVFFNVLGMGLLVATLVRDPRRVLPLVLGVLGAGLALKTLAGVALFDAPNPFTWLTPGVGLGLATGVLLLLPLARAPRLLGLIAALICLAVAVAAVNFAPENPYHTTPQKLLTTSATQLLRFSNIVRALSELWPFLAVGYLFAAAVTREPRRASAPPAENPL
jgi:VanZ family protein